MYKPKEFFQYPLKTPPPTPQAPGLQVDVQLQSPTKSCSELIPPVCKLFIRVKISFKTSAEMTSPAFIFIGSGLQTTSS